MGSNIRSAPTDPTALPPSLGDKIDWELENPMYNRNFYAERIVDAITRSVQPNTLLGCTDASLLQLAKSVAVSEMITLSVERINKSEDILQLFDMTNTEDSISLTFDEVGMNLMSDEVLNLAVNMLKEQRQNMA